MTSDLVNVRIVSNDDDSVTLECNGIRAHISADSWKEANEAAHMLGALISSKEEARKAYQKATRLRARMVELNEHLEASVQATKRALDAL